MSRKDPAAVALGRKGGQATSAAKADAARRNGKRGGRPPELETAIAEAIRRAGPRSLDDFRRIFSCDPASTAAAVRRMVKSGKLIRTDDGFTLSLRDSFR